MSFLYAKHFTWITTFYQCLQQSFVIAMTLKRMLWLPFDILRSYNWNHESEATSTIWNTLPNINISGLFHVFWASKKLKTEPKSTCISRAKMRNHKNIQRKETELTAWVSLWTNIFLTIFAKICLWSKQRYRVCENLTPVVIELVIWVNQQMTK